MKKYELTFWGAGIAKYFPRYKRWHPTREAAEAEVQRVYARLTDDGLGSVIAAHAAQIYGYVAPPGSEDGHGVRTEPMSLLGRTGGKS